MRHTEERIVEIANAMLASEGTNAAGASTGERIAGALLAGRPEWAGYTTAGDTDVFAMLDRLGPDWCALVRALRDASY